MARLTEAQFSQQCAYIAKNAAAWAADCLTLSEYIDKAADSEAVARFTDDMRRRLDRLDERAGRSLPATDTARPLNSGEVEAKFDRWWKSSKYQQVVFASESDRQIAFDAWRAALSQKETGDE